MPSRLRVFPNRRLIDHMRLALAMRKAGVMRPGSIWRRAAGLVLLAVVFMPAPTWAGDYTLAWRDGAWAERRADPPEYERLRFWRAPARIEGQADPPVYEPPSVTVNGVALSPFAGMHRIEEVRVLQLQAETLHVFRVWRGGAGQNYQLMLVRLADEGVEVIGPLQEEFEDIEIIPTRIALDDSGKDWPGYLFKLYLADINDAELVAVYRYMGGNGWYMMSRLSGPARDEWHENYTATREARIAEVIAAALTYDGLDPMARRILAGVIGSDGDRVQYGVLEARFPHDDPGTDRIRLTIGRHIDRDDYRGWGAVWLVEIQLWRPHFHGSPYVIENVILSGRAG